MSTTTTTTAPIDFRSQEALYASVVVTALEGGIGYWSHAVEYRYWDSDCHVGSAEPGPAGGDNAWARIVHGAHEEGQEGEVERRIDLALIDAAFTRLAQGPVEGMSDRYRVRLLTVQILARAGDTFAGGDVDSNDADNLVQVGLFGELVYG